MQSNTVVVQGSQGALLIDPGVTTVELSCLAVDLRQLDLPVTMGFATHPHWDHLLWHSDLGAATRYGTSRCAEAVRAQLADPNALARIRTHLIPPDIGDQVPLQFLSGINGLDPGTDYLPWDGPRIRIIEHQAHAVGHAVLLIEASRVLVAGDMLSDILTPMLDLDASGDPIGSYTAALLLFDQIVAGVDFLIPGHGGVGYAAEIPRRIAQDRAYLADLSAATTGNDSRLGPDAYGKDFLPGVHEHQVLQLSRRQM